MLRFPANDEIATNANEPSVPIIAAIVACPGVVEAARSNVGKTVAVNATNGQVTFNPDLGLKSQIASTVEKIKARKSRVIGRSADGYVTTDGTAVPIYANIGRLEDTVAAVAAAKPGALGRHTAVAATDDGTGCVSIGQGRALGRGAATSAGGYLRKTQHPDIGVPAKNYPGHRRCL